METWLETHGQRINIPLLRDLDQDMGLGYPLPATSLPCYPPHTDRSQVGRQRATYAVSSNPCQFNHASTDEENSLARIHRRHSSVPTALSIADNKMFLADKIRILDILPSGSDGVDGPIRCDIHVEALADKPIYEAISYRWGDPDSTISITVADKSTLVTANLYAVLRRLRLANEVRSVWIDQLCIDQEDMEEKAMQVRLMREIYSNCSQCLIWMDEIDANVSLADAEAAIGILNWMINPELSVPPCIESASLAQGPVRALASIGVDEHEWWKRIWTVQEVILPSHKTFLWGPLHIPWDTLAKCSRVWTGTGAPDALLQLRWYNPTANIDRVMGWLFCNVIWINIAHGQRDPPILTAMKWRGRKATDQRDKIFGLLGLLPEGMELPHTDRCNYETTAVQVYNSFTLDMILDDEGLMPLCNEPRAPKGLGTEGVARWAIDMDCEIPHMVDTFYRYWGYETYNACAGRELDRKALLDAAEVSGDHRASKLGLRGVMVDTIELTSSTTLLGNCPDDKVVEALQTWMEMARIQNDTLKDGLSREKFEEAFYRLLVGDRIRNGELWVVRTPTAEDLQMISEFIRTGQGYVGDLSLWDKYVSNQVFFVTTSGMMGLGHLETAPGDEVWVFDGGRMPFTIRSNEEGKSDEFDFVGCCYAHGIMEGEVYSDESRSLATSRRMIYLK